MPWFSANSFGYRSQHLTNTEIFEITLLEISGIVGRRFRQVLFVGCAEYKMVHLCCSVPKLPQITTVFHKTYITTGSSRTGFMAWSGNVLHFNIHSDSRIYVVAKLSATSLYVNPPGGGGHLQVHGWIRH